MSEEFAPTDEPLLEAIARAEETVDPVPAKPRLLVDNASPDETVLALRDILSSSPGLYDRGMPVRVYFSDVERGMKVQTFRSDDLVFLIHRVCRPYAMKERGGEWREEDVRFPKSLAEMYLGWHGERRLPVLNGIACSPLLRDDGSLHGVEGYDAATGLWCERVPDMSHLVPERPTTEHAAAALGLIRETFRTFCFADATMRLDPDTGVEVVDTSVSPEMDESSFLAALLTAVCRASLDLAPGCLIRAASISGAGAGKGLLLRCIAIVAFGREPAAVSAGGSVDEIEKRIGAELMEAGPVLLLDNLNNRSFRSDLLASVLTERPARVRILGRSEMVPLNSSALIALTGNGLTLSEDLARRFVVVELDPRTEDPESRPFRTDIKAICRDRRAGLLAACLTIWRWGRQATDLKAGLPVGSYGPWSRWVRDPLVTLGCADPVARIGETKARDGQRAEIAELFTTWERRHGDAPVAAKELSDDVRQLLDPLNRGRQWITSRLERLSGTRMAGKLLVRQPPAGRHGVTVYSLQTAQGAGGSPDEPASDASNARGSAADDPDDPDAFAPRAAIGWRGRL